MNALQESIFYSCRYYCKKHARLVNRLTEAHSVTQVVRGKYYAMLQVIEESGLLEEYSQWLEREGEEYE